MAALLVPVGDVLSGLRVEMLQLHCGRMDRAVVVCDDEDDVRSRDNAVDVLGSRRADFAGGVGRLCVGLCPRLDRRVAFGVARQIPGVVVERRDVRRHGRDRRLV